MRNFYLLTCFILLSSICNCFSQGNTATKQNQLLNIVEIDEDGKRITLKPEYRVVDPNSKLELTIDKDQLQSLASESFSADILKRMIALKKILLAEKESMSNVANAIEAYRAGGAPKTYIPLLQQQSQLTNLILNDPEGKIIFRSLGSPPEIIVQYANLFKTAALLLDKLEQRLKAEAKAKGIYVQLGAWITNKQESNSIHVPGFDSFTTKPATTVERFQVVLTAAQQNELKEIARLTSIADKDGIPQAIQSAKINVGKIISGVKNLKSFKEIETIYGKLETLKSNSANDLGEVKQLAEEAHTTINNYLQLVQGYVDKNQDRPPTTDGAELLLDINKDVAELIQETDALNLALAEYSNKINEKSGTISSGLKARIIDIATSFKSLAVNVKSDLQGIPNLASGILDRLTIGDSLVKQTLDFTNEVKKVSFDEMTYTTVIDLNTAGPRDLGNDVTIKIAIGNLGTTPEVKESPSYKLYFCKVYARTAVGFLFVSPNPIFKHSDGKAFFRYAPSYSILLKGFWKSAEKARASLSYHKLYAPGLGLNFSALDFNSDGAMELGIGAVFSIFQDFVQLGYGINTFDGRKFAFFGFKLPVGAFSIH